MSLRSGGEESKKLGGDNAMIAGNTREGGKVSYSGMIWDQDAAQDSAMDEAVQHLREAFVQFRRANWRQNPIEGLTMGEVMVLAHLAGMTAEGSAGTKVSELSGHLSLASPTVTQHLNSLENQGYIERRVDNEDRRAVRIRLTQKGEEARLKIHSSYTGLFRGLVAYLGEADALKFAELLRKSYTYLNEMNGPAACKNVDQEILVHD